MLNVSGLNVGALRACLHCGNVVPDFESSKFCCRGCAAVYSLLEDSGLGQYYKLREASYVGTPVKASTDTGRFTYLDSPEFLALYSPTPSASEETHCREMRFYLEGVHCAACIWLTEKLPRFAPGVKSLSLNLATGVATVNLEKNGSFARAALELAKLGYTPHPVKLDSGLELRKKEARTHLIQLGVAAMAAGNIMLLAVAIYAGANGNFKEVFRWVSFLLTIPVLTYSAIPFYRGAWGALRQKQVSIDVPIAFGLLMGGGVSLVNLFTGSEHLYFDSVTMLVFLLLSARYLLRRINERSYSTSSILHFLTPTQARRDNAGRIEEVPVNALKMEDVIEVRPGESFPVDGVVCFGASRINRALLTGESALQAVTTGDLVEAGTVNQESPVQIRVTASGSTTRLGKILATMEQSLLARAPIVTYLDRVGQAFVAAVLVLTAFGFFLGISVSLEEAIRRALAVAIIVCPCTFALATPLAMSLAMSRAARRGILVKGAETIERLSQVRSVFFDKTGTLTTGNLEVTRWHPYDASAGGALLALESYSAHPIARAVLRYFSQQGQQNITRPLVTELREKSGIGVSGFIDGHFFEVRSADTSASAHPSADAVETQLVLTKNGVPVGELTLADQVISDAPLALKKLREDLGLSVHLLSGDAEAAVNRVGETVGILKQNRLARATPEQKGNILRATPRSMMVGDGANDAIALAQAYTSLSVQGGMEVSLRAASAFSSRPGVMPVFELLSLSRETMRVIQRNLVFAVAYNLAGILVALTGHLSPLFAAILMPLSAFTLIGSTFWGTRKIRRLS